MTFPSTRGKAWGGREGGRAVQPQLPSGEQGSRLLEGCWGLLGGEGEGRVCQAEARWSLRRPPALATPVICPGLSAGGWRPGAPRRCHRARLPGASRRPASSWALLPAWGSPQGGLARAVPLPTGREAKSVPGPSTRTQEASVNSSWLICRRRGCLPSGRPRRAGGWEGPRDAALELEGPSRGHLLRLSVGGRPARDTRAQLRRLPECWLLPTALRAWVAGPPPPTDGRENRGLPSWAPPPGPASQLSEMERGRRGPELRSEFSQEAGRQQISHCPTSTSWETPGGTASLLGPGLH